MLETRPATNTVVVGASALLRVDRITCVDTVLVAGEDHPGPDARGERSEAGGAFCVDAAATAAFGTEMAGRRLCEVPEDVLTVQVRAHGTPSVVTAVRRSAGGLEVDLAAPVRGVAAGQSLVLYRGTRVLAEATISGAGRQDGPTSRRAGGEPVGASQVGGHRD